MTFKTIIASSFACMIIIFSTVAAWYEGSQILVNQLEWKYTTIFSEWINGPVEQPSDILTIDYFVYASKFEPAFPFLMLLSGTYLLMLLGYILSKQNKKMFSYFQSIIGILFLGLCSFLSNSPTTGLKIFFYGFLVLGIAFIGIAFLRMTRMKTMVN